MRIPVLGLAGPAAAALLLAGTLSASALDLSVGGIDVSVDGGGASVSAGDTSVSASVGSGGVSADTSVGSVSASADVGAGGGNGVSAGVDVGVGGSGSAGLSASVETGGLGGGGSGGVGGVVNGVGGGIGGIGGGSGYGSGIGGVVTDPIGTVSALRDLGFDLGGFGISPSGKTAGGAPGRAPSANQIAASYDAMSLDQRIAVKGRCNEILTAPKKFGPDLVSICRMLARL